LDNPWSVIPFIDRPIFCWRFNSRSSYLYYQTTSSKFQTKERGSVILPDCKKIPNPPLDETNHHHHNHNHITRKRNQLHLCEKQLLLFITAVLINALLFAQTMEADSFTIFPEYSSPPTRRTPANDRPTLLITYWCALLGIALIICRTVGRLVRIAKLYRDDKWMLATTILSLARLGFAHMVLLYGTNNTDGLENMSEEEVQKRTIGSGMVLGARVFFAA
jgi:hypothetical protein